MAFQAMKYTRRYNGDIRVFQEEFFSNNWEYVSRTPMYRDKMIDHGIKPGQINSLSDIQKVPFTYKSDLRKIPVMERTPMGWKDVYAYYSSGGTTGNPTLYAWNEEDVEVQMTVAQRSFSEIGVNETDLGLVLAPLGLPVMGHCMTRQYTAAGAGFVPLALANPDQIIECIRELPVTAIATLPSAASRLLEYAQNVMNIDLPKLTQVKHLHLGGDFLSEGRRLRLEKGWQAQCYNLYGISEIFGPVAGECTHKNGLHIAADYVYVEIVDPFSGYPVEEGQPGVAVLTTLWQKGSPLLRYWTDDFVVYKTDQCECGQLLPRIKFFGRVADSANLNNRLIFALEIEEILFKYPVTPEYYCYFEQDNGVSCVLVKVESVVGDDFPVKSLAEELEEVFHIPVRIDLLVPGVLDRTNPKPKRLNNFPTLMSKAWEGPRE